MCKGKAASFFPSVLADVKLLVLCWCSQSVTNYEKQLSNLCLVLASSGYDFEMIDRKKFPLLEQLGVLSIVHDFVFLLKTTPKHFCSLGCVRQLCINHLSKIKILPFWSWRNLQEIPVMVWNAQFWIRGGLDFCVCDSRTFSSRGRALCSA